MAKTAVKNQYGKLIRINTVYCALFFRVDWFTEELSMDFSIDSFGFGFVMSLSV